MLNFDNTEIAFESKTNKDLRKSKLLFSLVARPWMVKSGKKVLQAAIALRIPVKPFVKSTVFELFCGGETLPECDTKIQELGIYNIGSILDYSVEGSNDEASLDHTTEQIIASIKKAKEEQHIPFAVFKVSGIAADDLLEKVSTYHQGLSKKEQKAWEKVEQRMQKISETAYTYDVPLFVDAEDYSLQDAIDQLTWEMMLKYNTQKAIIFNTIQAYRKDRFMFLNNAHQKAKKAGIKYGVKLVRGAYMEKERERAEKMGYPSPIHKTKEETDACFNDCLRYIVNHMSDFALCNGTHNEESTMLLAELMEKNKIAKNDRRIYHAQLLGMSDHISFNLSHHGYNVAKYVPFGPIKEMMPYLLRRAEENTSATGQTGRELSLINKELKERKQRKKRSAVYKATRPHQSGISILDKKNVLNRDKEIHQE